MMIPTIFPTPRTLEVFETENIPRPTGFSPIQTAEFPSVAAIVSTWLAERARPDGLPITWQTSADLPPEGFDLTIGPSGVRILAADLRGAIYAASALCQVLDQAAGDLPALHIRDFPAMPIRATHIDLRTQKFRPAKLRQIIDRLAYYRYNMVVIEYEGAFPLNLTSLPDHRPVYSPEVIVDLYHHAAGLGIELVPLIQTMGHLEYLLQFPAYLPLCERGADGQKYLDELCPLQPGALSFALDLLDQVMALHPGHYVHIGGDEVWHLGSCDQCREREPAELYLKHMLPLIEHVHQSGRTPLFWADFLKHHPEAVERFPAYAIPIEWEYEPDPQGGLASFARLRQQGLPAWTAPAVHCYRSGIYGLDVTGAISNVERMACAAYAEAISPVAQETGSADRLNSPASGGASAASNWPVGAPGVLITNWNTGGSFEIAVPAGQNISQHGWPGSPAIRAQHRRPHYDITWPLLIWSAECLWNAQQPRSDDFWENIGYHLFGVDGPLFYKAYLNLGAMPPRSSPQQTEECFARAMNGFQALHPTRNQDIWEQLLLTAEYGWHHARGLVLKGDYAAHLASLQRESSDLRDRLRAAYERDLPETEVIDELGERFDRT